jgi:RsiW-degrading membrane proteinase PrsW (M82 family)
MNAVQFYGYFMAAVAAVASIVMFVMGGKFQNIEANAYAGKKRPWWFVLISATLIVAYCFVLYSFLQSDKTWAGWVLVVLLPVGWALKATMVVFNPKGRATVSAISGDSAWRKVALARFPIAIILAALAFYA